MIEYQYAFIKTKAREISIFPTHNLEVPGSSPGWSTYKRLNSNELEPFFISWPLDYESVAPSL